MIETHVNCASQDSVETQNGCASQYSLETQRLVAKPINPK